MYFLLIFVLLGHSTLSILTVATYIYITYSLIKAEMLTSFVKYALGDNPSSSRNLFPIILNWCHHYHAIHSQVHHHLQSWRQHLGQQARAHARWHVHTHIHTHVYIHIHTTSTYSVLLNVKPISPSDCTDSNSSGHYAQMDACVCFPSISFC